MQEGSVRDVGCGTVSFLKVCGGAVCSVLYLAPLDILDKKTTHLTQSTLWLVNFVQIERVSEGKKTWKV